MGVAGLAATARLSLSGHPQLSLRHSLPQQSSAPTMSATEHPDQAVESVSAHCVVHAFLAAESIVPYPPDCASASSRGRSH